MDIIIKNDILEAIAKNSIFGIDDVHRVYEIFKSYDLLVLACEFAASRGYSNLETACILCERSDYLDICPHCGRLNKLQCGCNEVAE